MKKTIELLKNILEGKLKGKIKGCYIGDPWLIPESMLPCLMIAPERTETDIADNCRDNNTHTIGISLVIDARQYFNATPEQMVGTQFLMETMESEESSTEISPNSVLGVLRDNLTLEVGTNRFISNVSAIDYTVRRRTEELITLEAIIHLDVQHIVNR